MERTLIADTVKEAGEKVQINGWVKSIRKHGKIMFVDVRDRSGVLQVVFLEGSKAHKKVKELKNEDAVLIEGEVKKRETAFINPKIKTGKVELAADKLEVLSGAASLPFDIEKDKLEVGIDTLFDNRSLVLRNRKVGAIFKVQEEIVRSFRATMKDLGFLEFFGPTIVASATEGGADVFKIDYYDYDAYLAQSPQLYKQILVSAFERVFTVAHAYRAEPSMTTRHMSEYIGLDAEMGFIKSLTDITCVVEKVLGNVFADVEKNCKEELGLYKVSLPRLTGKIPMVKLREAQEIIYKRTKRDNRKEPDLSPEDEREICRYSKEELESELIFITHYPVEKRPFYTYPDPDDPGFTLSFDLIGRGVEWVTGGQRIHDWQALVDNIKKRGLDVNDFKIYLAAFEYGMPPEGGFCLGLERLTQHILGLSSVKEASLFPRDMERVDIRLSSIQKKKKKK